VVHTSAGKDGITTAAHCNNQLQVYGGPDLNFKDGMYGASWDVQWHSHPSEPFPPYARDATAEPGTPYYRIISDKKPRSAQNIGDFVCKYGRTTGFDCGDIIFTNYCPSYIPNVVCTWMVASNDHGRDLCSPGDSGGPVYTGDTALGIISGIRNDVQVIYMAQNFVSDLGLSVKVSG
jgi:streptogrisin C